MNYRRRHGLRGQTHTGVKDERGTHTNRERERERERDEHRRREARTRSQAADKREPINAVKIINICQVENMLLTFIYMYLLYRQSICGPAPGLRAPHFPDAWIPIFKLNVFGRQRHLPSVLQS
jgi:hypothetical protein